MHDRISAIADHPSRQGLFTGALLDLSADPRLDAIVQDAAKRLNMPLALVTFVLDRVQLFRAHVGLPADLVASGGTDRDVSFCQFVVRDGEMFEVTDAREDCRVPQELVKSHNIRSYLGAPVRAQGEVLGSLCVMSSDRREFSASDRELLLTLAADVSTRLAELSRLSRLDQRELQLRSTRGAFAELRNLLVVLEGSLSEARYELAQLALVSRSVNISQNAAERLLLQQAATAAEGLGDCIREAGQAASRLRRTTLALEDVLADGVREGQLPSILQHVDALARHLTKLIGGVRWTEPIPEAALRTSRAAATALLTCTLSALAWKIYASPESDGPIVIRVDPADDAVTVSMTSPRLLASVSARVIAELGGMVAYQPGVSMSRQEERLTITFQTQPSGPTRRL
ncbi:MAG: GAF domain-containing protein [Myxococcota bacterium]